MLLSVPKINNLVSCFIGSLEHRIEMEDELRCLQLLVKAVKQFLQYALRKKRKSSTRPRLTEALHRHRAGSVSSTG
jgi:hypothetical protein